MTDHAEGAPVGGAPSPRPELAPRTRALLEGAIAPTLLRLAWPNTLISVLNTATGLLDAFWVSRLGADALAGVALVFPLLMLSQMLAGGAIGGGISSSIARALGARQRETADELARHALVLSAGIGLAISAAMLLGGRAIYSAMGASGGALEAALTYSNVVFSGSAILWTMSALLSIVRGGGDMIRPALVACLGIVIMIPLSPALIFGLGPFPQLGVAGGGAAQIFYNLIGIAILLSYAASGRGETHVRPGPIRLEPLRAILRVGGVATLSSLQTNATVALSTALVGATGGALAVAGYGAGVRLEFLAAPIGFGLGAPLVALVGANVGAGQIERAERAALTGGILAFCITSVMGLAAALFPTTWMTLFSNEPATIETGRRYLQIVGPFYGFFSMGMTLYFASQGAGKLFWPLFGGFVRLMIAVGGGWLMVGATGDITWAFVAMSVGLVFYGTTPLISLLLGQWRRP